MDKLEQLKEQLKSYRKVAIAYSGGCDSHFLYTVAKQTLGKENVLAVICFGDMMSKEDIDSAKALLSDDHYEVINIDVLAIDAFRNNRKDRCYFCKKNIMSKVIERAHQRGFTKVLDGMNNDDQGVYRPGRKACQELNILSPLQHMYKSEIRNYSKQLQLSTAAKPANACLASRFPYDTELTKDKLMRLDSIESLLHQRGILHVRCRIHHDLVRIEAEKKDFDKIISDTVLIDEIKAYGFHYVTLDLKGISSGSYDQWNNETDMIHEVK